MADRRVAGRPQSWPQPGSTCSAGRTPTTSRFQTRPQARAPLSLRPTTPVPAGRTASLSSPSPAARSRPPGPPWRTPPPRSESCRTCCRRATRCRPAPPRRTGGPPTTWSTSARTRPPSARLHHPGGRRGGPRAGRGRHRQLRRPLGQAARPKPRTAGPRLIGIVVAIVVLLLGFGSVLAAGCPSSPRCSGAVTGLGVLGMAAAATTFASCLAHAGRDDGPRRRHRLRPVPDHPAPAADHGRRRPGRGGRPRPWPPAAGRS